MKRRLLYSLMLLAPMLIRAQYHLDTLHYAGDSKVFIDIVYLGDGFTEDEMDKFADFVKEQNENFFDKTPLLQYKSMFNVFYVKTPSNVSGAGMTPDATIDNIFGTCFGTSGVDRMPWPTKWGKVNEVLNAVKPDYDLVPIVVNSEKYGGGGGSPFICFSMNKSSIEVLRHESGHALGGLADEYWYKGREAANMTQILSPLKWERWMDEDGVGTYRHSNDENEEAYNWYRPHQQCLMRYLNRDYCPVCREALIERIHARSKNVISYTPEENTVPLETEDVLFSLNLLKPEPNTLRVEWLLDGESVALGQDSYRMKAGAVANGTHQLTAIVEDTTLMVRTEGHSQLHAATVVWDVSVNTPSGIISVSTHEYLVGPLPFETVLVFSNKHPQQLETRMELLNTAGFISASATFQDDANCRLTTTQLPAGVYLLRVYQKGQLVYQRKITKR